MNRMKKIGWNHRARNTELLNSEGGEEYPAYYTVREGELDLSHVRRNRLLEHVIAGEMEAGRERRRRLLLEQFQDARGYWKLKKEAVDRTVLVTGFGRGCGSVVRQTAD